MAFLLPSRDNRRHGTDGRGAQLNAGDESRVKNEQLGGHAGSGM